MSAATGVQPFIIDLEITNACPADCPMCPREKLPSIGLMSEQTFSNVLKFIDDSKKAFAIGFCGIGEALLHPKIFEFIERLKQLEFKPHISIVTAGERLTPEVFEKLKNLGVDGITLSLQAIDEDLYKKLMPGLKLKKVLKNIDYISENPGDKLDFAISLTVHKMNENNSGDIIKFVKSKNLKIILNNVHTRGGNMVNTELTDTPTVNPNPLVSCKVFEYINFISWTGDIHPCCQDVERINKIGNVNNESVNDISLKKTGLLASGLTYKICSQCNDGIRLSLLTEKKIDPEQMAKNDQELGFKMSHSIGIFGEYFLSNLSAFKTSQDLLGHIDSLLNNMAHTLKVLNYLRNKYPHLYLEIYPLKKSQVINDNILASFNINRDNLTSDQLEQYYSFLIDKYGLFCENLFEKILQMPRHQIISMVNKHFSEANDLLNKDLILMFLLKEKMAKKQISINKAVNNLARSF